MDRRKESIKQFQRVVKETRAYRRELLAKITAYIQESDSVPERELKMNYDWVTGLQADCRALETIFQRQQDELMEQDDDSSYS